MEVDVEEGLRNDHHQQLLVQRQHGIFLQDISFSFIGVVQGMAGLKVSLRLHLSYHHQKWCGGGVGADVGVVVGAKV